MERLAALLFTLAVIPASFAQDARVVTTITTDTKPAWKTWHDKGCSLNYPETWTVDTTGTQVLFQGPAQAKGAVRVALFSMDLGGKKPADFMATEVAAQAVGGLKDAKVLSSIGPDDSGAYMVEAEGNDDGAVQHRKETVRFLDGKVFLLLYSATPPAFEEQLFLADAMLNSFSCPGGK